MNTDKIQEIVASTMALPREEREAYLTRVCGSDGQLRRVITCRITDASTFDGSNAAIDIRPGDSLGVYRILEQVGEGGMGTVFLADQREPVKRRVAMKVIKLGMDTKDVLARFEIERQALALMNHPNVSAVYDAGATQSGRPFFVMEYVQGIPITDYCDQNRLPINDRVKLFSQACDGVQHAHQKGIIHRDLKPGNILVTEKGDGPLVKIIDFGVAKSTQQRLVAETIFTRLGVFIGTPQYASPEQAGSTRLDVDTRTDVYSLGIVLYQLLVGEPPFDREVFSNRSYDEIQRIIRESDPPTLSVRLAQAADPDQLARLRGCDSADLSKRLKGDLSWIVMRAIEKDRNARYPSASALSAEANRFLENRPVESHRPKASRPVFSSERLKDMQKIDPQELQHTVLLVDDEVANNHVLAEMLSDQYQVLTAADGAAAIELIKQHSNPESISLVVSDQRMPKMTGLALFERLNQLLPKAIRIIITGYMDVDVILEAINHSQIYQFIIKPVDRNEMLLTVRRAIEAYELQCRLDAYLGNLEYRVQELSKELKAARGE